MFSKILVPIDGSQPSLEVLPVVGRLVEGTRAEVTLLTAGQPPNATTVRQGKSVRRAVPLTTLPGTPIRGVIPAEATVYAENRDQAVERREHELLEYLAGVARPLIDAGCRVHMAVHFGEPVEEITELARRGGFDLIAMATHGRSGLSRALHGSVTSGVVRSGVVPVLVVRPKSGAPSADEVPG